MLSDNLVKWWSELPPEGKQELAVAMDISIETLRNNISLKRTPSDFNRCIILLNYSSVLASKYGVAPLTPHDIDTKSNIKVHTPISG